MAFQLWGQVEVDPLASLCTNHCQHYYTLENSLPLGAFGLHAFNYPWTYQVSYVFPPPVLVPLVLSTLLGEHVTGQLRLLILAASCWMEAIWLPTVFNMLEDILFQCSIVKDLIMDVSVGQLLISTFSFSVMVLFLFLQPVVTWIDKVTFHLKFILNLIPTLIFTLYFT